MTPPELPVDGSGPGAPVDNLRRPKPQLPSIGRVVHYRSFGTPNGEYLPECRAAIITAVDTYQDGVTDNGEHIGHVALAVFNPDGLFLNKSVLHDEDGHTGGTWHWPERV